jgi:hypothetical protein
MEVTVSCSSASGTTDSFLELLEPRWELSRERKLETVEEDRLLGFELLLEELLSSSLGSPNLVELINSLLAEELPLEEDPCWLAPLIRFT